jgi:nucleotide-binding universal stress UspA family protein
MGNRTRTILCGVDGSEQSVRAATVTHALGVALGAEIVLAHVSPGGVRHLPVAPAAMEADMEGDLQVIADTAARAGVSGARTRRVKASSPTDGLVATARVELPYLIVIGASGHSLFREALLGSVAGELPLKAPCPVVVAPPHAAIPELGPADDPCVVCGVGDSPEAESAARAAGGLATGLEARLIIVNAQLPLPPARPVPLSHHSLAIDHEVLAEEQRQRSSRLLERALEWSGRANAELATEIGDPAERIEAVAAREAADLIVVASRGRGPLRAAVLGSTSRMLAASAGRPVVIVGPSAHD